MTNKYSKDLKIGILGGGQLARFLSLKAQEMGLQVRVLTENATDPAALVTDDVVLGSPQNESALKSFLNGLSVVTFESEFIDPEIFKNQKNVYPSPLAIGNIRDRWFQKKWLHDFKIPTAPMLSFESNSDLSAWLKVNKKGLVLKKRLFGYDGYGTMILKSSKDLEQTNIMFHPDQWIAEEFCAFKKELAFSLARSSSGAFYVLPLVETQQKDSRCDWVKGPVKHAKFLDMQKRFQNFMKKVDYVGLLSVELFETSKGLLVNELAPRVHNSAHYSIEALNVSQFEAHLRAILDWPFSPPVLSGKGFAMVNLIGSGEKDVQFSSEAAGSLHWYHKIENKPGRKMGHFTTWGPSADKALKSALKWRKQGRL